MNSSILDCQKSGLYLRFPAQVFGIYTCRKLMNGGWVLLAFNLGSGLQGRLPTPVGGHLAVESLHATSLPGALANNPLFLPPWLNATGQEWPLGNISKGYPLSGHLGTFTEAI